MTREVIANVSTYLGCLEMDKFEAVDTEEEVTTRGLELLDTNQLWGGLVSKQTKKQTQPVNQPQQTNKHI